MNTLLYLWIGTDRFAIQSYQKDEFVHLVNQKASIRIDLQNNTFSSHSKEDACFQNYVGQIGLQQLTRQLTEVFPDCELVVEKIARLPKEQYSMLKEAFLQAFQLPESIFIRKLTRKCFRAEEVEFLRHF